MENFANQFSKIIEDYTSEIDKIKNSIDDLGTSWQGKASFAFNEKFNSFYSDIKMVLDNFSYISGVITTIIENYKEADNSVINGLENM